MKSTNTFYNEFDLQTLKPRKIIDKDYRTPFQIDRDRIIYSSAFRRLQSKTQVFLSGEYDFYRTRLTHSLEVAQIAKAIGQFLFQTSCELTNEFYIDLDLIEAISLTHDIGHPPFAHTGEKILQEIMEDGAGGFEGNAQSLRIITELIYSASHGRLGMAPSRAFLDGIMKYKVLFNEPQNLRGKYLLDNQKKYLAYVYNTSSNSIPEYSLRTQSLECQIMDWADNTAYSINDLIDGYKAGFISVEKLNNWESLNSSDLEEDESRILSELKSNLVIEWKFEKFMARQIGRFIQAVELNKTTNVLSEKSSRYAFNLIIDPIVEKTYKLYKKIAIDLIFSHPAIQQLEFKGKQIVRKIFETLKKEYFGKSNPHIILPPLVHKQLIKEKDENEKVRIICDHIAGMSDAFVIKTYKRLFDPDFGSIVDLV
ncbi:MAG: dNTP triphosphohydrolase [Calditrichia bacterium]|nr:dNTP triphosphohydrolase [Calditrichia bacterium]